MFVYLHKHYKYKEPSISSLTGLDHSSQMQDQYLRATVSRILSLVSEALGCCAAAHGHAFQRAIALIMQPGLRISVLATNDGFEISQLPLGICGVPTTRQLSLSCNRPGLIQRQ
jgi:hypothetical protein